MNNSIKIEKKATTRWLDECFRLMDTTAADSHGEKWTREDLYVEDLNHDQIIRGVKIHNPLQ